MSAEPSAALILPGGGARGAYQVGVLKAVAELLPERKTPFPIIAGTSAGGINAAVMASHVEDFSDGARRLEHFWGNFRCHHIYRTGWLHNLGCGLHWLASMTLGGWVWPTRGLCSTIALSVSCSSASSTLPASSARSIAACSRRY